MFTAPDGGSIRVNNLRRRAWASATVKAGLAERCTVEVLNNKTGRMNKKSTVEGLTFHDMRHTAVAPWIATGANDLQVALWAGHRSVAFGKDRDGHLYESHAEAVVARLDALIAESAARPSATVVGLDPRNPVSDPCRFSDSVPSTEGPHPL